MDSDDRFKHLASDPRFKTLRRNQRKVEIDDRFKSMFTDDKFALKYKQNKRGWRQNKTSADDLKRFYSIEDKPKGKDDKEIKSNEGTKSEEVSTSEDDASKSEPEVSSSDESKSEVSPSDGSKSEVSSSDESASEDSSSDESESEDDQNEAEDIEPDRIKFNWQPLDYDAEKSEITTQRLAFQNLDWDQIDVKDLYVLVKSIRMPLNVKIYISEFGKERLAKEEIYGPQEIAEMPKVDEEEEEFRDLEDKMKAMKNTELKSQRANEYEDADEELDIKNEEIRERVRKYQLNKMRYYYAIAEFDSVESAELVYKELDGLEYEGSSLELDLRFVPDDVEFDPDDVKAECNKVPDLASYKAPLFISSALQQTTVKFTWDQTDVKRQAKLRRAYTKEELEKDDLAAYLASESDSDEEEEEEEQEGQGEGDDATSDRVSVVTANSQARINKYKNLLKSLDEEEENKKKVDVDVVWGDYEGDEERQENAEASDSDHGISLVKKRKQPAKEVRQDDDLDLLVMEPNKTKENFRFDPNDDRFNAVYESALYNIDPSHPNFKRTEAFDLIAENKRKKRLKSSNLKAKGV